jgi:hypothetical protein
LRASSRSSFDLIRYRARSSRGKNEHSKRLLIALPNQNCLTHLVKQSTGKELRYQWSSLYQKKRKYFPKKGMQNGDGGNNTTLELHPRQSAPRFFRLFLLLFSDT